MLFALALFLSQADLHPVSENELRSLVQRVVLDTPIVDVTEYFGADGQYVRVGRGLRIHGTYTVSGATLCRQASTVPLTPAAHGSSAAQCHRVLTDGESRFFLAALERSQSQVTEVRLRPILELP